MPCGLLECSVNLPLLNQPIHNKVTIRAAVSAKNRKANRRGALSTEAMAAIAACVVLVLVVALTMRDKKPRFRFDSPASPTPAPAASAAPSGAAASASPGASPDLQALFVQGRAESQLIAPVDEQPAGPPFVTSTDYAVPPAYREIREADMGAVYAAAPKNDRRALSKVAKLGGFGSPEAMARAFGYPTVDQMVSTWDQTIATTPKFQTNHFGTNSTPPLPWQD